MSAAWLAAAVLAAVALETSVRLTLAARQLRAIAVSGAAANRRGGSGGGGGNVPNRGDAGHQRAAEYARARLAAATLAGLVSAALTLALTLGGGIGALDALWRGTALGQPWLGAAVIITVLALQRAAQLPFAAWRTFRIDARFGFNRATWRLFAADTLKRAALGFAIAIPASAGAVLLMASAGRWWWLPAAAAWLVVTWSSDWLRPVVVAPLFNRFTPLADRALAHRFALLLDRCGFRARGVLVMDASSRSSHGNAYFAGIGRAKRIVVHDTLLERLDADELEAVLAHELGHYRLRHLYRRLATSTIAVAVGLGAIAALAPRMELYAAFGIEIPSAHAALALLIAVAPTVMYLLTPLAAWRSRQEELAADDFAVQHASARGLASALERIYRSNAAVLRSDRWYSRFYETHPPPAERLARLRAAIHH